MGKKKCYAAIYEEPQPPAPVKTLAEMTEEEIQALEKKYGMPVKRSVRIIKL